MLCTGASSLRVSELNHGRRSASDASTALPTLADVVTATAPVRSSSTKFDSWSDANRRSNSGRIREVPRRQYSGRIAQLTFQALLQDVRDDADADRPRRCHCNQQRSEQGEDQAQVKGGAIAHAAMLRYQWAYRDARSDIQTSSSGPSSCALSGPYPRRATPSFPRTWCARLVGIPYNGVVNSLTSARLVLVIAQDRSFGTYIALGERSGISAIGGRADSCRRRKSRVRVPAGGDLLNGGTISIGQARA